MLDTPDTTDICAHYGTTDTYYCAHYEQLIIIAADTMGLRILDTCSSLPDSLTRGQRTSQGRRELRRR